MRASARVSLSKLTTVASKLQDTIDDALGTTAHSAEGTWKEGVRVDTANYRDSIGPAERIRQFLWAVSSPVEYGPFEELGTVHMRGSHAAAEAAKQAADDLRKIKL